jgi:hypothetical protein
MATFRSEWGSKRIGPGRRKVRSDRRPPQLDHFAGLHASRGGNGMKRSAVIAALALFIAAPARAQEARTWMFNFDSDTAVLLYGTPESDDAALVISCEPGKKSMHINEFIGSADLVPGRAAHLKLSNGTAVLDYAGQTIANEMDGTVNIEVSVAPDPKLIALLKSGSSLTVDVAGKPTAIPLKDAAPHVAEFEKACWQR